MKLLDFRKNETSYNDDWAGRGVRAATFQGHCALCGTRTYAFTDGQNDPRGPLGDHAAAPMVANDYGMVGPDVPACFMCQNDTDAKYNRLLTIAKGRWYDRATWRINHYSPNICEIECSLCAKETVCHSWYVQGESVPAPEHMPEAAADDWDATRIAWGLANDD